MTPKLCECGCGLPAPIAAMTNRKHGHVRGEPVRFVRGHAGNLKRRERLTADLWTVTDRGYETECWIWNGHVNRKTGYCRVKFQGKFRLPHRVMYEQEIGAIPAGLDVDHLCSQRDCCRPLHLEAVTRGKNIQRSRAAKMTDADVIFVRASGLPGVRLADLYGVRPETIYAIRRGDSWKDL